MKGFMVWGLGTSKIAVLVFLFFTFLYPIPYTLYPTFAADSTPSAEVQSKLEELKREIASKAAKIKQEINQKLQNKAYVGIIKTKSTKSLTLATKSGPKFININQDTIFENKSGKKVKSLTLKDIKEEDYIAGLGDIDDIEALTAKKIILLPAIKAEKQVVRGTVVSLSEDDLVVISDQTGQTQTISTKAPLKINDLIITTGILNEEIFVSSFVYVYQQAGEIKPKK